MYGTFLSLELSAIDVWLTNMKDLKSKEIRCKNSVKKTFKI